MARFGALKLAFLALLAEGTYEETLELNLNELNVKIFILLLVFFFFCKKAVQSFLFYLLPRVFLYFGVKGVK